MSGSSRASTDEWWTLPALTGGSAEVKQSDNGMPLVPPAVSPRASQPAAGRVGLWLPCSHDGTDGEGCLFGHRCGCRTRLTTADLRQAAPRHWKQCAAAFPLLKSQRVSGAADPSRRYNGLVFFSLPSIDKIHSRCYGSTFSHSTCIPSRIASCMGHVQ